MSVTSSPTAAAVLLCAGLVVSAGSAAAQDAVPDVVRVGRYTQIVGASLAERDPLAVVASLSFPRQAVANIGDALGYLLQRAGFTAAAGDATAEHLFTLPLPESQRQMGPHPVLTLAGLLAGEGFTVSADPRIRVLTVTATDASNPEAQP